MHTLLLCPVQAIRQGIYTILITNLEALVPSYVTYGLIFFCCCVPIFLYVSCKLYWTTGYLIHVYFEADAKYGISYIDCEETIKRYDYDYKENILTKPNSTKEKRKKEQKREKELTVLYKYLKKRGNNIAIIS
eukprot:Pgem_evm1s546